MSAAFDTLKYANELEKVNFSKDQAEKLAVLQKNILDQSEDSLSTKEDLDLLRKDILLFKNELTIKIGTMFIAAVGILIAVIKL